MSSINKVFLVGRLGQDPEIRTANGQKIATLSLATSETWKDKATGERKDRTEWHRVVIFNDGLVGIVERYLRKGTLVGVTGELRTRKWADKNGVERYTTEVVVSQYRGELALLGKPPDMTSAPASPGKTATLSEGLDDEIPF